MLTLLQQDIDQIKKQDALKMRMIILWFVWSLSNLSSELFMCYRNQGNLIVLCVCGAKIKILLITLETQSVFRLYLQLIIQFPLRLDASCSSGLYIFAVK